MLVGLCFLVFAFGLAWFSRSPSGAPADAPDNPAQSVFEAFDAVPVSEGAARIAAEIRSHEFLIPIGGSTDRGDVIEFAVSHDANGQTWLHGFSSVETLAEAIPEGSRCAHMTLEQLLDAMEPDHSVGGLTLDSASVHGFVLPRVFFPTAREGLAS